MQVVATEACWRELWRAVRRPRWFLGRVVGRIQEHRTLTFAAALAYYFMFALFPFMLFLLALVSVLPGVAGIEEWLLRQAGRVVPPDAFAMMSGVIRGLLDQPRGGLLSLGAALALWSASSALVGLADALNVAYGVRESRPWWRVRLQCLGVTAGMSLFMIVAFVGTVSSAPLSAWVASFLGPPGGVAVLLANWSIALAAIVFVIATIYDKLPDVQRAFRWFTPGSVVFTVGFGVTSAAFSAWVARFGSYDKTYGSLGAVIVLLLWMYLLATFVLLGGEIDATLTEPEVADPPREAPPVLDPAAAPPQP